MCFGILRALISDKGTNFINCMVTKFLTKFHVNHIIATTYHPQKNGQAKMFKREIKKIREKVVNTSYKD